MMKKIIPFITLQVLFLTILILPVFADDPVQSPSAINAEAHVMTDFIQDNDLVVMIRYELPLKNWQFDQSTTTSDGQIVTSPYMQRATCADNDNAELVSDLCYTSIFSGVAMQNVYNGKSTTDPMVGSRTLPRIGHGISAIYFPPGHNLSTSNLLTCLATSSTLFTNPANECIEPTQHPITDTNNDGKINALDREIVNGSVMANIANNLDDVWPLRGMGVLANGQLTPFVTILFYEATPFAPRAAPSVFAMAVDLQRDAITLSKTKTELEKQILANATSTQSSGGGEIAYGWFSDWVTNHYNDTISVNLFGSLVFFGIALVFLIVSWVFFKNGFISLIFFVAPLFFGMMSGLMDMQLIFVTMLLVGVVAIFSFVRRWA